MSAEAMPAPASPETAEAPSERQPLLRRPERVAPVALAFTVLVLAVLPLDRAVVAVLAGVALLVLAACDLERALIPNRVVLPAILVVLVAQLALFPGEGAEWVLATLIAGVVFLVPHAINRAWIGMGDVKLAMLIGASLGAGALTAVPLAFLCVFPVSLAILVRGGLQARSQSIPFGPFLAFGALVVLVLSHLSS